MKRLFFVTAIALSVAVLAGCNCSKYNRYDNTVTTVRYNPNPVCPPPPTPCPPQIACTPAPQPVMMPPPMPMPAPQPACPLPNNACQSVAPLAPFPQPAVVSQPYVPGRISYAAEPVQVSGANTVQYYNPYAAAPRF